MKLISILTKITGFGVGVCFFCFFIAPGALVMAQTEKDISVAYNFNIALDRNFSAQVQIQAKITNASDRLIDTFSLTLPFKHAVLLDAKLNSSTLGSVKETNNDYPQITASFGDHLIRPGQSATLSLTLTTNKIATSALGIYSVYIPKLQADYQFTSATYTIKLDPNLPEIIFISNASTSSDPSILTFSTTQDVLIQWAGSLKWDLLDTTLHAEVGQPTKSAVNLVPQISGQKTDFVSILDYPLFAQDKWSNLWLIDDMSSTNYKFAYAVKVAKTGPDPLQFTAPDLSRYQIPLEGNSDGDNYVKLKSIYSYVTKHYPPTKGAYNSSVNDLNNLNGKISSKSKLTALESNIVLARFLQEVNVPARVVYGFVLIPNINDFDPTHAHVWVEALVDNVVYSLDPGLSQDVDLEWIDPKGLNRLVMGVWDPANTFDSAIGLVTNSPKSVPDIVTLVSSQAPKEFTVSAKFPETAYAGQFYSGEISLTNKSNEFLHVSDISISNEPIPLTDLALSQDLTKLVPPYGTVTIPLNYLKLGNLFYDGQFSKDITVTLSNPGFATQKTSFSIKFIPNLPLMFAIIALALILSISVLLLLSRRKFIYLWKGKKLKLRIPRILQLRSSRGG